MDDPGASVQAGIETLHSGDATAARLIFERAAAARPGDLGAWFGLALAYRALAEEAGEVQALDRVLNLDPRHIFALSMKADHFARTGDDRAAQAFYGAVVANAPSAPPPAMRETILKAKAHSDAYARAYEAQLLGALARAGFDPETSSRRFGASVDILLGRKKVFLQSPKAFYFPELPQRQFYERGEFPWMAALEAKTEVIRDELLGIVGDDLAFRPYVRSDGARPPKEFGRLRDRLDWSAYFLIEDGAVQPEAAARCPATLEALSTVPLCRADGCTPSVLFSVLRPGARIPPHTGHNNARLICHLPLIVPEGCGLRVGNETRPWSPGQMLIFDDSIEHEAWNDSGELRAVLLFDIWRPELSLEERDLVAATLMAVNAYGGSPKA
jgi:aspartyl/asparaginyl beta-hydroxylase (cupin superfamily)